MTEDPLIGKMVFYLTKSGIVAGITYMKDLDYYRIYWTDVGETGTRWKADSILLGYPSTADNSEYEPYVEFYKKYGGHNSMAE